MRWDIVYGMHECGVKDRYPVSVLEEPSLVCLLFYRHLDVHMVRLYTGLERRARLETLKPFIAIVFLVCTDVVVLTHPRRRVNTMG